MPICHNGLFYTDERLCPKSVHFLMLNDTLKSFSYTLSLPQVYFEPAFLLNRAATTPGTSCPTLFDKCVGSLTSHGILSSVYTNAVSFETASFLMRLRLLFTRHRSRPLPKPGRFENAANSGAFSKRYGFI